MSARKNYKIRKPSKFTVAAATYFAEHESGVAAIHISDFLRDPRQSRDDGGKIRAVMYGDDLRPVFA